MYVKKRRKKRINENLKKELIKINFHKWKFLVQDSHKRVRNYPFLRYSADNE